MSIGIYKVTSPSGKTYIGQSVDIERRFKHYANLNNIKGQIKVYHSMKKYGYENHTFEMIEECTLDELDSREIYWISYYQSNIIGLNISEGGNTLGKLNKGKKRSEETKQKISATKKQNPRILTQNVIETCRQASTTTKPVYQYDLDGNYVNHYVSINEAARQLGIRNDGISACLRKKQNTAYGYQWFYEIQSSVSPVNKYNKPETWIGNRNLTIDDKIDEIISLYNQGNNITEISYMFNVHRDVIKKRIKENDNLN